MTFWSLSTSKVTWMCIRVGLEGLKTENVEKTIGFAMENGSRVVPRNRLTGGVGGVREGEGRVPLPSGSVDWGIGDWGGKEDSCCLYTPRGTRPRRI